jgi:dihydrofolate reductase
VLSRNPDFTDERFTICRSLDELFDELKNYSDEDIFIIGGASIYSQLLPYCTEAYVTKIENEYPADRYFVNLEQTKTWKLESLSDAHSFKDIHYKFAKYVNTK